MKKLYIIRHGDSPIVHGLPDFERDLSEMGRYDAINIGLHLSESNSTPSYVLSSSAKRALTTARIVTEELGFDTTKIVAKKELHNADMNTILDEITKIPSENGCIMVFGHNPGLSELVSYLSGENFYMDTCNVVLLNTEIENWSELTKDSCTVDKYLAP